MRVKGILACLVLPLLASCGGWQKTTRSILHAGYSTANTTSTVGKPLMHQRCMEVVKVCADARDATCKKLVECQRDKQMFTDAIVSVHRTVMMGLLAVELGDKNSAMAWATKVQGFLVQLAAMAETFGLDKKLGIN